MVLTHGRGRARREFEAYFERKEPRPYGKARRYVQTLVGEEGFARRVLESIPESPVAIRRLEPDRLVEWVARESKVSLEDLMGPGRRRSLSHVRALCGYLGREVVRLPLAAIARELGRGQSTLWRDVDGLERSLRKDRALGRKIAEQRERLARLANNT